MTTNERYVSYRYEFYRATEESDPDPIIVHSDNTDDCEWAIAACIGVPRIRFVWIERDGDADRYNVVNMDDSEISLGVAYVTVEYFPV